jgi:hypothetical protein
VHTIRPNHAFGRPNKSSIVRDDLLIRILANQLERVTIDTIRLIVTDEPGSGECRRKNSGCKEISMRLRIRKKHRLPKGDGASAVDGMPVQAQVNGYESGTPVHGRRCRS